MLSVAKDCRSVFKTSIDSFLLPTEIDEFLLELDEDVEGMQNTIYYLQQQLKEAKEKLAFYERQTIGPNDHRSGPTDHRTDATDRSGPPDHRTDPTDHRTDPTDHDSDNDSAPMDTNDHSGPANGPQTLNCSEWTDIGTSVEPFCVLKRNSCVNSFDKLIDDSV